MLNCIVIYIAITLTNLLGKLILFNSSFHRYIFPGLALGAALGQTGVVTNAMINRSAEALVELISEDDLSRRATFPENHDIREISLHLALRVIQQALEEGLEVIILLIPISFVS